MKEYYETKKDAFIAGYVSADEADADTMQTSEKTYHSNAHAYLSGVSAARKVIADKARETLESAKDADAAADAVELLVDATKDAYVAAKAVADMTGYMSSYATTAEANVAKLAKAIWKAAQKVSQDPWAKKTPIKNSTKEKVMSNEDKDQKIIKSYEVEDRLKYQGVKTFTTFADAFCFATLRGGETGQRQFVIEVTRKYVDLVIPSNELGLPLD
jgi:hypothetical protein